MKIGIFHGYNITGSGSNEYTRYLTKTFLDQGHSVDLICREYKPETIDFVGELWQWDKQANCKISQQNSSFANRCRMHQIPYGDFYPVYVSDKKHSTVFKEFVDLSDDELQQFIDLNHTLLGKIFSKISLDVLHCNHIVMQPSLAATHCKQHNIPLIIYPHGSDIEYTVKKDKRYQLEAKRAIEECAGLIIGNREVRDRICNLFPDLRERILSKTTIVGVGVDTQLFQPSGKLHRSKNIATLLSHPSIQSPQGKRPELLLELHKHLQQGHYSKIANYDTAYDHNSVDVDIKNKLTSIDFSQPVILFVGALTPGKGLQSVVCALPEIYKAFPGLQLLIIGKGAFREVLESFIYALANRDQQLLHYLLDSENNREKNADEHLWSDVVCYLNNMTNQDEYFVSAKQLTQQVVFLGRFNHTQLSYIFPCANLAIFPSIVPEAYPLVLMESLANGVIPMVSYFSGFKDGVDELNQYLDHEILSCMKIPLDTATRVETIVKNVKKLLPLLQKKDVSMDLANIARENYDWTKRAEQMVSAYCKYLVK